VACCPASDSARHAVGWAPPGEGPRVSASAASGTLARGLGARLCCSSTLIGGGHVVCKWVDTVRPPPHALTRVLSSCPSCCGPAYKPASACHLFLSTGAHPSHDASITLVVMQLLPCCYSPFQRTTWPFSASPLPSDAEA